MPGTPLSELIWQTEAEEPRDDEPRDVPIEDNEYIVELESLSDLNEYEEAATAAEDDNQDNADNMVNDGNVAPESVVDLDLEEDI